MSDLFTYPSTLVPTRLPFQAGPNTAAKAANLGVGSLVPAQGPYPYPQTFGPPAPPGGIDHWRVSFGPGPTPLFEDPPIRIKRTNYVMLGNLLIRPFKMGNWHNKMRDGQILWVARNAQVGDSIDLSQEVRNLTLMNHTLRAKGSAAYRLIEERIRRDGIDSLDDKLKKLWTLPETATANADFWNVRATDPASKRFFDEYWALSPYGILERYGWPIGVSYISPTVSSHIPMPPSVDPANGPSFRQITVALKGECNMLNVFPDATNLTNCFLALRRERLPDGSYSPYFQWIPMSSFDETPDEEELRYLDIAGQSFVRAHYIFIGTVSSQTGIVLSGEALKRAQGRTVEDSDAHYEANMALSVMRMTLKTRHFGFLAPS